MRRLARWLFTLLSAASLLLCVAIVVLWVRSYRLTDLIEWRGDRGWRSVRSAEGRLVVGLLVADWSGSREFFHGPRYLLCGLRSAVDAIAARHRDAASRGADVGGEVEARRGREVAAAAPRRGGRGGICCEPCQGCGLAGPVRAVGRSGEAVHGRPDPSPPPPVEQ